MSSVWDAAGDNVDFTFDGSATEEKDLQGGGGFLSEPGYAHVMLDEKTHHTGQKNGESDENELRHIDMDFRVLKFSNEKKQHVKSGDGKLWRESIYLEKWKRSDTEFEVDREGKKTDRGVKLGKEPINADDFQQKAAARLFVRMGLLKEEDVVGKKWTLPWPKIIPGLQYVFRFYKDKNGRLRLGDVWTPEQFSNPDVADVPMHAESLAELGLANAGAAAGTMAGGAFGGGGSPFD